MVKSFNTKHSVLVLKRRAGIKRQAERLLQKVNRFRIKGKKIKQKKNIKYSPHNTTQFLIGKQITNKEEHLEDLESCSGSMIGKSIIGQYSLMEDNKENWSTMDEDSWSESSI